jgi:GTP-binding protein
LSSSAPSETFTVAVLGRTNVGKSTLFNRLVGRRRSITDPTPGVTRDVLEGECLIGGLRVRLLDTGGYSSEPGELAREISRRSLAIAGSSQLALLLVEASGLAREDFELIEQARRLPNFRQKVVLVINKVDGPKQELALGEFQALGFARQAAVSAAHGRGIAELKELIRSSWEACWGAAGADAGLGQAPREQPELRLAILGKPNTGKSTLLNLLLGEERALVSEAPGTTRDPVSGLLRYRGQALEVLDTAGIRRKNRVSEAVEYYSVNRAIKSIAEADVVVLLMDAREGVSDQDKKIASLAVSAGRGVILALNKCDLLAGVHSALRPDIPVGESAAARDGPAARIRARQLAGIEERVRFVFPLLEFAPLVALSAVTGYGVNRLLAESLEVGRQLKRRVSTGRLNAALQRWVAQYPLPVRGRNVKIRYATQTSANPVRFLLFVNSLRQFPDRYLQYLKNRIRADLGFAKVPVEIQLRES